MLDVVLSRSMHRRRVQRALRHTVILQRLVRCFAQHRNLSAGVVRCLQTRLLECSLGASSIDSIVNGGRG